MKRWLLVALCVMMAFTAASCAANTAAPMPEDTAVEVVDATDEIEAAEPADASSDTLPVVLIPQTGDAFNQGLLGVMTGQMKPHNNAALTGLLMRDTSAVYNVEGSLYDMPVQTSVTFNGAFYEMQLTFAKELQMDDLVWYYQSMGTADTGDGISQVVVLYAPVIDDGSIPSYIQLDYLWRDDIIAAYN
ncbi:MAG: hypothetical protein IJU16_02875 [Clostridia bacterium]|nr:hypothetical protein [Clostridia bacterium]